MVIEADNMTQDSSYPFYNGKAWRQCREAFMQSKFYICERCGGVAVIAHHKEPITPHNITDNNITLNWDNLLALCIACHNTEHGASSSCSDGLEFDINGNLKKI